MNKRDYWDYLQDILEAIQEIANFIAGMDFETFTKDRKTINAVVRSTKVIGEAATEIPKSLQNRYPNIPWKKMATMSNTLIHKYFGIDLEILWEVASEDIPSLKSPIEAMVTNLKN